LTRAALTTGRLLTNGLKTSTGLRVSKNSRLWVNSGFRQIVLDLLNLKLSKTGTKKSGARKSKKTGTKKNGARKSKKNGAKTRRLSRNSTGTSSRPSKSLALSITMLPSNGPKASTPPRPSL